MQAKIKILKHEDESMIGKEVTIPAIYIGGMKERGEAEVLEIIRDKREPELPVATEDLSNQSTEDKAPVDEAPVDKAPVDEAPVEEAPVEEAPVEEGAKQKGNKGKKQ